MTARQRLALDTEVRLLDFASLLATAISNARAHERITRLADEQAALRRIATLVAEGAAPNRVFEAVRHEIARTFDLPITVLMRYDADDMATMVATHADSIRPVGSRWRLGNHDTSAVARVFWTGRPARTPIFWRRCRGRLLKLCGPRAFASALGCRSWSTALSGEWWLSARRGQRRRRLISKDVWRSSRTCSRLRSRTPRAAESLPLPGPA